jgi:hypothetical protein
MKKLELLRAWQAKKGCRHETSQRKADRIWDELKSLLTTEERRALGSAVSHLWVPGEPDRKDSQGSELDAVCEVLVRKWRREAYEEITGTPAPGKRRR